MKILRSFNKEQITVAVTVALCSALLAGAFLGGRVTAVDTIVGAPDRPYARPPSRFAEFVQDDFRPYWAQGSDIWRPEYATRLQVPTIRPPEPRPDALAAPMFRPGPLSEVYNRLQQVKTRYPGLAAGAPVIPEAEAPPAAEIEAVKKLEEPPAKPRPDRRAEKLREKYTLVLKSGGKQIEGEWSDEDATSITIRDTKGQRVKYPRDLIDKILPNWTLEEKYQKDSRAIKPGPQEAADHLKLALWCFDECGMVQEAEAEARRMIELKKDSLEGYLLLGRILLEQGNVDGAVAAYASGIAAGAYAPELQYEIGRCYRMLAPFEPPWYEAAAVAFERALDASPRHQKAKAALARTLLDLGQVKAAAEMASDFFLKLASSPDTRPSEKVEAFLVRGVAMIRMGDLEKARADLSEAVKLAGPLLEALKAPAPDPGPGKPPAPPTPPEAVRAAEAQNAEALNGLAVLDALEGKHLQAATGFIAVIKASQYTMDAWTNLGILLLMAGRYAEAEAVFTGAIQRDPVSADALLGLGMAQALGGKADGAASIEKALQVNPAHAEARAALAYLKLRAVPADDEAALELYREALRNDYYLMPAYYGAASAYLRAGRKARLEAEGEKDETRSQELSLKARQCRQDAETLLRKLRTFDPGNADTLVALGAVYALLDRPDEANEALRAAAQILQQKMDPLLHYVLGYVEYWHPASDPDEKRLDKALGSFSRCAGCEVPASDTFGAEVVKMAKEIVEGIGDWKVTSLRLDERFEREPSAKDDVGGGWFEIENNGIDIKVVSDPGQGGRCRFSGQQSRADMGLSVLERQIPAENFYAMEVTLFPAKVQGAEFGVSIYYNPQQNTRLGLHVGFNAKTQPRYHPNLSYPKDMDMINMDIVRWIDIKTPIPDPAQVTLRIVRGEKDRRAVVSLFAWDAPKGDWAPLAKDVAIPIATGAGASKQWWVSIWGRAMKGQSYALDVDNVRIYERVRK
jgi:tetratricopeptide (TPR) repeat protein